MDKFSDDTMCRICFKKQDTVFSLFRKRKGLSPCEKLNKIGVKAEVNDTGPSCICCDCLTELETTVHFLEKCKKSNQILAERLGDVLRDGNALQFVKVEDVSQDECGSSARLELESGSGLVQEEARCGECGARRRCRHWTPPATHTCPHCQKVFNRKYNFKLHLARHSRERLWSCGRCGARVLSRWLAARHCAPRARRACPLPGCGKTYTTATNLSVHLRGHSGERPFECNACEKKFSSKNTLQNHIRIHTGVLPYICPICGKQFRTNKLSAHMSTHGEGRVRSARVGCGAGAAGPGGGGGTPRAPPPHACVLCAARYHHKQSLNKHVRKQHAQQSVPAAAAAQANDITKEIECDLE